MHPKAKALSCPKCRSVDRVYMASSHWEKLGLAPPHAHETLATPVGTFMLVYLLGSLQFLTQSVYEHLTEWPSALSAIDNLLPRPLLSAATAAAFLLVALDRPTRPFLLRMGRAAALDSRLYQELDVRTFSPALVTVPLAVASFGWAVFLGLSSLDTWVEMAKLRTLPGPDWMPLAAQGFLAGGLVALAGLPLMAFIMTRVAHFFADYGALQRNEASFGDFARNLAYPYSVLSVGLALVMTSGLQVLIAPAICWFLAATFMAARHTVKRNTELALPVTLMGTAPVILAFFFVKLRIQANVVNSNWNPFRGQTSPLPDLELSWLVGAVALAALLALTALLAAALTRRNNVRADPTSEQAAMRWRHLLYCERCNGVHLPNQEGFVPASEVSRLLFDGRNEG